MNSGIVRGSRVASNRSGPVRRLLQVEITDPTDVQTVELLTQSGIEINPVTGSMVSIIRIGDAWKLAISSRDNITPDLSEGETEIYATDGSSKLNHVKCKNDGLINVSNGSESLHTLVSDLIDAIVSIVTTDSASLNTASQAALNIIKARFLTLLGGL